MCLLKFFGSLVYTYLLFAVGTCHRSRTPSDRIAFAVRSDCVRRPIRLRSVNDDKATATAALTQK